MKRFISRLFLAALVCVIVLSCKKDDDTNIAPPRDYALQYVTEKADIENYLKTHYIDDVNADFDVVIKPIPTGGIQTSIWDQTTYPLQSKPVTFGDIVYTVYYLALQEGVGDAPTRGDNILAAYRGTLMDEGQTQFDFNPFPQNISSLHEAILGWQEIIPLFKEGIYSAANPENPASFSNYGAGVMFLPSALAYYNRAILNAPAYSPMVFSFKLYRVEDADVDGDGLTNKQEMGGFDDVVKYDSDGDGRPNYLDTDDDNDGTLTRLEVTDPATDEIYAIDPITNMPKVPSCDLANPTVGIQRHLDPNCDDFQSF